MIKDTFAQLLFNLGIIAMFAGVFPPAAHVYDLLTCKDTDAVVEAVRPDGKVRVAFHDAAGRPVTAVAAHYHLRRGAHAFATRQATRDRAPDLAAMAKAAPLRGRAVANVGETVHVIYRSANPTSLAPHRNPMDALFGLGVMLLGALMLLARRAFMPRTVGLSDGPEASRSRPRHTPVAKPSVAGPASIPRARAAMPLPPAATPNFGRPAGSARPARVGAVQRERGWI